MKKQLMNFTLCKNRIFSFLLIFFLAFLNCELCFSQTDKEVETQVDEEIGEDGGENGIEKQISDLLGEAKDQVGGLIKNALGASAIAEVASLRKVISESFTRQNKLAKAALKIEEENNKAFLTISKDLANYYKALKLLDKLKNVTNSVKNYNTSVNNMKYLSAEMKKTFKISISNIGDISKITRDIKVATNQNNEPVWMSEGERVQLLDTADKQIAEKMKLSLELYRLYFNINKRYEARALRNKKLTEFSGLK